MCTSAGAPASFLDTRSAIENVKMCEITTIYNYYWTIISVGLVSGGLTTSRKNNIILVDKMMINRGVPKSKTDMPGPRSCIIACQHFGLSLRFVLCSESYDQCHVSRFGMN